MPGPQEGPEETPHPASYLSHLPIWEKADREGCRLAAREQVYEMWRRVMESDNNFYRLRDQGVADYKLPQTLPLVKLDATSSMEDLGPEKRVRVSLRNPSNRTIFFAQLALQRTASNPAEWGD